MFIIGGYTGGSSLHTQTIARYSDGVWTKVAILKQGRYGHSAITVEGKAMIIGGSFQRDSK